MKHKCWYCGNDLVPEGEIYSFEDGCSACHYHNDVKVYYYKSNNILYSVEFDYNDLSLECFLDYNYMGGDYSIGECKLLNFSTYEIIDFEDYYLCSITPEQFKDKAKMIEVFS